MDEQQAEEQEKIDYQAYLLRLWRVSNQNSPEWRGSLEGSNGGELMIFNSLDELYAYLVSQTE